MNRTDEMRYLFKARGASPPTPQLVRQSGPHIHRGGKNSLFKSFPVQVELCLAATQKAMMEVKRVHYG